MSTMTDVDALLEKALKEANENDEYEFEYDENGTYVSVEKSDGYFCVVVDTTGEADGRKDCTQEIEECNAIRDGFYKYMSSLDSEIFSGALDYLDGASLFDLNDTIANSNTPSEVADAVKTFTDACNRAVQDKVAALKSQMW